MRLDQALKTKGFFSSREKAKDAILDYKVRVNGIVITKPSYVIENETIEVIEASHYVSRSAWKLKAALDFFQMRLDDHTVLDIGSSTGGFTQVALEYGAKKIYALDVGTHQLAESLRADSRVISLENTHFLKINPNTFDPLDTIVCDVSFISSLKILDHIKKYYKVKHVWVLFKPQFEANKPLKNPVIKDKKVYQKIQENYESHIKELNFKIIGAVETLKGKEGNQERMYYLRLI